MEREALKPYEINLGNFIESMGKVEIVTGIIKKEDGGFQIGHCGWNHGNSMLPDDIMYQTYPIPLTDEWKVCFNIDKFKELPEWIKYVHEVQNYFLWALRINILEIMDWHLLPKDVEIV